MVISLFLPFFNTLMADQIDLIYKGVNFKFPLVEGTENESAIDIKTLRSQTGLITLILVLKIRVLVKVRSLF